METLFILIGFVIVGIVIFPYLPYKSPYGGFTKKGFYMPTPHQMTNEVNVAISRAHQLAIDNQQDTVSATHVLLAFAETEELPFSKCVQNLQDVIAALKLNISQQPKRIGRENTYKLLLSQELEIILRESSRVKYHDHARKLTTHHILISLIRNSESLQLIFSKYGITEDLINNCLKSTKV